MNSNHDDHPLSARDLIAKQLRRLRERAGLSVRGLAEELNISHSHISDMERRRRLPTDTIARVLDRRFDPPTTFTDLLTTLREALVAPHMRDLLPHERNAVRVQEFNSSVIPGLLQTEACARALLTKGLPRDSPDEIEARVAARRQRRQIFQKAEPPLYWAIIDEIAFLRAPSERSVMLEQLRFLEEEATKTRITVQIYPTNRGLHGLMGGSLNLWSLEDGRTLALVESFGSGEPIESPAKVSEYVDMFDVARLEALTPEESLRLIQQHAKGYQDD